jgi:predicted nuclease of restriction endonuclease-like (RecB) superfamily
MTTELTTSKNYLQTLEDIKKRVKSAQLKAHFAVNKEMLILYFQIGKTILERQEEEKWGTKVIERLAQDLKLEFPQMKGFSKRNLEFMQQFALSYKNLIPQQLVSEIPLPPIFNIPWGHNIAIMQKIQDKTQRLWYAKKAVENGWSRFVLKTQIETNLYSRQAIDDVKTNNFFLTLPENDSDLANEIFKDEYNFEFIDNSQGRLKERELEKNLVDNVIKFLTELGKGFAFVGKQYHLEAGDDDYYIDLLFYHLELRSYIIIELKTTKFKPEYAGKMAFYLSQVDKKLKKDIDNDSIGIILCKESKNKEVQETINYITKPMGVAGYQLAEDKKELPKELKPLEDLKSLLSYDDVIEQERDKIVALEIGLEDNEFDMIAGEYDIIELTSSSGDIITGYKIQFYDSCPREILDKVSNLEDDNSIILDPNIFDSFDNEI